MTEISKATGVHKSTASRILATLESRSLVSRNEWNSKYSLGMRLVEYARRKLDQIDVLSCARPYLERLVETTSETAHLALLDHHEIVYIDKVDTPQTLMMRSRVGNRAPAQCPLWKAAARLKTQKRWQYAPPLIARPDQGLLLPHHRRHERIGTHSTRITPAAGGNRQASGRFCGTIIAGAGVSAGIASA